MKIALASPRLSGSFEQALLAAEELIAEAAAANAAIICFPESYLPGYPLSGYSIESGTETMLRMALEKVCGYASQYSIAVIMPMDWYEAGRFYNVAQVISDKGVHMGFQTKNQLDPSEDKIWNAGETRQLFEIRGIRFGVTICHEGFRYPESVRWAAQRGAHIVFHPQCTGDDFTGTRILPGGILRAPTMKRQ